ncbi:MAG: hypothetical protein R3C99_22690 [Pirellulaceae bacterium]
MEEEFDRRATVVHTYITTIDFPTEDSTQDFTIPSEMGADSSALANHDGVLI